MMDWNGGMGGGAWIFMGVFWAAALTLIIFLVVRLLPSNGQGRRAEKDSPEELLDRRFARGDLDVETYQAQRAVLASSRAKR